MKKLALLLSILLLLCMPVFAADYIVTNCDDSGAGSLRQAIINANGAGSDARI